MSNYTPFNTTVILLAAGRGARMGSLTEKVPKPLLKVGTRALIEHHLYRLADLGFRKIIINTAYLADQFPATLGDGSRYRLSIQYSDETRHGALETAGGIHNALPLIESDPFLVVNSDIWTDIDFTTLLEPLTELGRLVMVDNPVHNKQGDFTLSDSGYLNLPTTLGGTTLTFSGVALYHQAMFTNLVKGKQALAPLFRELIAKRQLRGIQHRGEWVDVGTPERLDLLNQRDLD